MLSAYSKINSNQFCIGMYVKIHIYDFFRFPNFKEVFKQDLKLGFVLVNKLVNNFFYKRVSNGDRYINPDGGTVIDRGITRADV